MMPDPKPITLTTGANPDPLYDPQPFVVVSGSTQGSVGVVTKQAAIANESTANATDLATAQALANALKTKVNAILAALRSAGVILP